MSLLTIGLSHRTAPVEIRERIAFTAPGRLAAALAGLRAAGISEAVLLSTCNRTELYVAQPIDSATLTDLLGSLHPDAPEGLDRYVEERRGHRAVEHLFRVATGLESMILGETDILRQVKEAYSSAAAAGLTGPTLNPLFHKALEAAKRARTELDLSRGAFSVGHAASELAQQLFGDLQGRTVLVLGAGDMSETTARHLTAAGASSVIVANRTFERAARLAESLGGHAVAFERFAEQLVRADIVISSTAAPHPIVHRATVAEAMRPRRNRPLFLIDIAVPRDIEASVGELEDVYLYDLDDLQSVVDEEAARRRKRAVKAEAMILNEAKAYGERARTTLAAAPLVTEVRAKHRAILQAEQERLRRRLPHLSDSDWAAIQTFGETVLGKIAHDPTLKIKAYAEAENPEKLATVRELFALDEETP